MDRNDELKKKVADLMSENRALKDLLAQHGIEYSFGNKNVKEPLGSNYDMSLKEKYDLFTSMFRGRSDVFSKRSAWINPKTGKCGYYPQKDYRTGEYRPISGYDIVNHLKGSREDCSDVVGIYPMRSDETCYFLVFDFDDHDATQEDAVKREVSAMRQICVENNVSCLVERSRSGKGYHLWIFFEEPIEACIARDFGSALLTKGSRMVSLKSFKTFDRMIPASDHLPINRKTGKPGIGNMVALPLQGQALKYGNSAFVDEGWNPYKDQWGALANTAKLSRILIEQKIREWGKITDEIPKDETPWEKVRLEFRLSDVDGVMQIVLADRIYIDTRNVCPCLQNQLRCLAAFNNPEYFKKQAMGFSTHGISRIVYCGEDSGYYICLPRGLLEILVKKLEDARITYSVTDKRYAGKKIKVKFKGKLFVEQREAARKMLEYENGILSAATAFGKTVLGAYLISKLRVNTLILVHNYEILEHWKKDLDEFLEINHELPVKLTPKGRRKKLKSIIGVLKSTSDNTTGIVDIAMISSLGKPGEINELVKKYGLVIMDECHHSPSRISDGVLREIQARYFYGLTATPMRNDGLKKKMLMTFGPIRYCYSAKDRAEKTKFNYIVQVRPTDFATTKREIYEIYEELTNNEGRNKKIVADAIDLVSQGKTPIVVTRFRVHAEYLKCEIKKKCKNTFLLVGGKDNRETMDRMNGISTDEPLVLVATGQYIGEGFNYPRLDTLIMATPVSYRGIIEQYAGRINRDYPDKQEVIIVDYLDSEVPVCKSMYRKRKVAYRAIGYTIDEMPSGGFGA